MRGVGGRGVNSCQISAAVGAVEGVPLPGQAWKSTD